MSDNDFECFALRKIEEIYNPAIHKNGWCMFWSCASALGTADVVFIGMNPGGQPDSEEHANQKQMFMPDGHCPYIDEVWDGQREEGADKLQKQVVMAFETLNMTPRDGLCGNIVPFRTSNWGALPDKENTLKTCAQIWKRVYAMHPRKVTICMGDETCKTLSKYVLESAVHIKDVPLSWGKVTASLWKYQNGVMIRLPHLSRYSIFGRPESESALMEIFAPAREML